MLCIITIIVIISVYMYVYLLWCIKNKAMAPLHVATLASGDNNYISIVC